MQEKNWLTKTSVDEGAKVPSNRLLDVPIRKAIFILAWPTMLAGLMENMATTVDMIMVGRLGAAELASVGFCAMVNWAMTALVMGINVAITAIVARNTGAGKPKEGGLALGQALVLSLATSIGVAILIYILAPSIFRIFGVEQDVYALSVPYLRIIAFSGIFFGIMYVCAGALRGAGDARTPLYIGFVTNIIHIILNYLLIFGKVGLPPLGVRGAAIGSLLSLLAASAIYLFLFFNGTLKLKLAWKDFQWDSKRARAIIRLSLPAAAEQFVMEFGLLIYAKFIVIFGTLALSGYQVGMQALSLSYIPNGAFAVSAATLVGQNLGAVNREAAKKTGWICLFWAIVFMCSLGIMYFFAARPIASIFVNDPEVIRIAVSFIRVMAISQLGMAIYFTLAGALRGAGDTRSPLVVTLVGMYGVRIPAAWFVTSLLGLGVEVTFSLLFFDYIVRIGAILYLYQRGKWLKTRI